MLRITIPSTCVSKLTFTAFERYGLPAPPNGVDAEINNNVILLFSNEEDALTYARQLENLSLELNDRSSPENLAISDIIMAIRNDEFVQGYTTEN